MEPNLDTARLRERLIALTRDLVLIPGSEERPTELQRALQWVGNHLESLEGVRVTTHESNGSPSLMALPEGCEKPGRICLDLGSRDRGDVPARPTGADAETPRRRPRR